MLEVKDVTIAVGNKVVTTQFSFIARDGQVTCITGPEGSGKTVFVRTLMGFLPVQEGFVIYPSRKASSVSMENC